ncbi:fibronectin type III domain-containing protein [Apilactobacillus xinyiensis]|uniref:fibronectin type III domain-containing protein n=1 Tax=Apilactobacillus xinyiensis TaxID=2841032 RepID=UPI003364EF43
MSSYKDTILTQRGSSIASDAAKGKLQFTITRTVASNADFSNYNDDNLAALTKLPNEIQNGSIVDELDDTDQQGTTGTQVRFTNTNVKTAFKINAVGLYAKINGDDTEYLYSITLADSPYFMNDYSNKVYNQFDLIIYVVVGDKANLNLNINPDNFVSYGYLQKRLDLKADKVDLDKKADKSDLARIDLSSATKDANKYTDDNAMLIARDETVTGIKDFSKGFKVNGKNLSLQGDKLTFDGKPLLTASAPNAPKLDISIDKDTGNINYQITPSIIDGGASVTAYTLYYKKAYENNWQVSNLDKTDVNGNIKVDKGVYYQVKVTAKNYAGSSYDSDTKNILTAKVPKEVSLSINNDYPNGFKYNVTVGDDGNANINGYQILYKKTSDTTWQLLSSNKSNGNITNIDYNVAYQIKAKAQNVVGISDESNTVLNSYADNNIYGVKYARYRTDISRTQNQDISNCGIIKNIKPVTINNETFTRIPKFYIKKDFNNDYYEWNISAVKPDDSWYLSPVFIDYSSSDKKELPYVDVSNTINYSAITRKNYHCFDMAMVDVITVLSILEKCNFSCAGNYRNIPIYNRIAIDNLQSPSSWGASYTNLYIKNDSSISKFEILGYSRSGRNTGGITALGYDSRYPYCNLASEATGTGSTILGTNFTSFQGSLQWDVPADSKVFTFDSWADNNQNRYLYFSKAII